jgi:hypothetical protein
MIADAILIFLPLRTLRELKNQLRLRRRLQAIFAASALTTCASIVSGVANLCKIGFGYLVVVQLEVRYLLSFFILFFLPFEFALYFKLAGLAHGLFHYFNRCRAGSLSWSATSPSSPVPSSNSPIQHRTGQYTPLPAKEWAPYPLHDPQQVSLQSRPAVTVSARQRDLEVLRCQSWV